MELFIGVTNRNAAFKKNAADLGWFVLQQAGHSYFGAVALPGAQGHTALFLQICFTGKVFK